jgi:hypothetical protein
LLLLLRFAHLRLYSSTNNENIVKETDEEYVFPSHAVRVDKENVITVVQDNMGLDESEGDLIWALIFVLSKLTPQLSNVAHPDTSKSPRGIRGFHLNDGSAIAWKVQGKIGGYQRYVMKIKAPLLES